jgi:hypothetical protein
VAAGWSRNGIEKDAAFARWRDADWFKDILSACKSLESNPRPSLVEVIMPPPPALEQRGYIL